MGASYACETRDRIGITDPFAGFDAAAYPDSRADRGLPRAIESLFAHALPKTVVEVGCWRGESACLWAKLMTERDVDGVVICIDTWLGSLEHFDARFGPEWDIRPYMVHGFPNLYFHFLANVARRSLQHIIVPVPCTSVIGAKLLRTRGISADLVYIDASHEEDDVYADLNAYWPVLRRGGIMAGDDFSVEWYPVICAVNRFAKEKQLDLRIMGKTWAFQKPL